MTCLWSPIATIFAHILLTAHPPNYCMSWPLQSNKAFSHVSQFPQISEPERQQPGSQRLLWLKRTLYLHCPQKESASCQKNIQSKYCMLKLPPTFLPQRLSVSCSVLPVWTFEVHQARKKRKMYYHSTHLSKLRPSRKFGHATQARSKHLWSWWQNVGYRLSLTTHLQSSAFSKLIKSFKKSASLPATFERLLQAKSLRVEIHLFPVLP